MLVKGYKVSERKTFGDTTIWWPQIIMYISKTAKRVDFKHSHYKGMISGKVMSNGSIQCFHNVFMYQNITPHP